LIKDYYDTIHLKGVRMGFIEELTDIIEKSSLDIVVTGLCGRCHQKKQVISHPEIVDAIKEFVQNIMSSGEFYEVNKYCKYRLLDKTLVKGGF